LKKTFFILSAVLVFYSFLVIISKPAVVAYLKKKIEHTKAGSTISAVEVRLYYGPWSLLCLRAAGEVSIKAFEYEKFKAQNIKAKLRWEGKYIYLDSLTAQSLKGTVDGRGKTKLGVPLKYVLYLNFTNLDLGRFVEDFELMDKFLLTGLLNGRVTLVGTGKNIHILNGNFTSLLSGGDLTIKDTRFLENMALSSKIPTNLVVDSFKNYHYNKGLVRTFMDHGDLGFNVTLEGDGGKRDLKVILHNFSLN
jgi:hypothetical protein